MAATAPSGRGEAAEVEKSLKALAAKPTHSSDAIRERREVFRKVVHYMSLGIDMSGVFTGMINNCASPDQQLKRLLYEYIAFHARSRSDMALLCVNTLQKDCNDADPGVRSLALRSLVSLRFQPGLLEHLTHSVASLLDDADAGVRATAVIAALKVYCTDRSVAEDKHLVETVERMLKSDRSARVKAACVDALKEALGLSWLGQQRRLLFPLLNDLPALSEWAQGSVLDAASYFTPDDEDEAYKLLNAVDDRIDHQSSYVALSAVKACLNATKNMPVAHQQVYERAKDPLIFLAETSPSAGVSHCVTCHLALLAGAAPPVFEADRAFFVPKLNDEPDTKVMKLHALAEIAGADSAHEVASELSFSASHEGVHVARAAIKALGRLTSRLPEADGLLDRLFNFLSSSHSHCQDEAIVACVAAAQSNPPSMTLVVDSLATLSIEERELPSARRALAWVFGAFSKTQPSAAEKLEEAMEYFTEELRFVKLELLTAAVRCFLAQPSGETKALLSQAFQAAHKDLNTDVKERAHTLLRLLKWRGPQEASQIIGLGDAAIGTTVSMTWLSESQPLRAFNTLEAVLQRNSSDLHTPVASAYCSDVLEDVEQQEPSSTPQEAASTSEDLLLIDTGSENEGAPVQQQNQSANTSDEIPQLL